MSQELARQVQRCRIQDLSKKLLARHLAKECEVKIASSVPDWSIKDCSPQQGFEDSPAHCIWMCREVDRNLDVWSSTKMHRWVGFVQGVMRAKNWSTVDELREMVGQWQVQNPEDADGLPSDT